MIFADITNDTAFRKIFGNENKKKSLISFLNAIITLPGNEKVVDIELTNPFQLGRLSVLKYTIVDVKARDSKGNIFIVEMQVAESRNFHKRVLYYTSQGYSSQLAEGDGYEKLRPVFLIAILDFVIGKNPSYFSKHVVQDLETQEHIIQDVEFNFIELPKFNKTIDQLETSIDEWIYFIKNAKNLLEIPNNVSDEGLREAYREAEINKWGVLDWEDYNRASMKKRDDIGIMELAVERAETRGEIKGEKTKAQKIAKSMKEKGYPIEDIIEMTGLAREEIESL